MTPQKTVDIGILFQVNELVRQAQDTIRTLNAVTGQNNSLMIDNITSRELWKSTQVSKVETREFQFLIFNN